MKIARPLAALLCTLLLAAPALAEGSLTLLDDSLPECDFISGTSLLRLDGDEGYAVGSIDGTALTDAVYTNLSGYEGYIVAAQVNADPINAFGLLDAQGKTLIPFSYGDVDVLSSEWALGVVLTESTADNYDYQAFIGDGYYLISTVDVYHLPDGGKLGTFERANFMDADPINHCLNIEDRATGTVTTYDAGLNALGTVENTWDDDFAPADYETYRENGQYGIRDKEGNVVMEPAFYSVYDYKRGYFEVSTGEKSGLVNAQGHVVVPAEYDDVETSYYLPALPDWSTSGFEAAGYFAVELDGKLGFVDGGGNVTCAPTYSTDIMDCNGASATLTDLEGNLRIVAADGAETIVSGYDRVRPMEYGSGIFYTVTDADYKKGVIDWHGNEVLPCTYADVELSADGQYLLADIDYDHSALYQVTYPAPGAAPDVEADTTADAAAPEAAAEADTTADAAESGDAADAAAPEAAGADAGSDAAANPAATLLDNAASLIAADATKNRDAAVALLQSAEKLLGEDHPAAGLLQSAATLLNADAAMNAGSVGTLLESAKALL